MFRMDKNGVNQAVGEVIRVERIRHRWSQLELAKRADMSLSAVRRYESGERAIPIDALIALIDALGVGLGLIERAIKDFAEPASMDKSESARFRAHRDRLAGKVHDADDGTG